MDSQENKKPEEVKREPCLICGIRRRREDCLVCLSCSDKKNGLVGQLKTKIEAENERVFLADELEKIVDPWDATFVFVLEKGPETIEKKQVELSGFIKLRETKKAELRKRAENEVATKLATLGKGKNRALYLALFPKRDSLINARFEELKQEDDDFGKVVKKVYGLGKSITAMKEQLKGVSEKRTEHLNRVEESTVEGDEVEAAAA